jgi:hypothetical protein
MYYNFIMRKTIILFLTVCLLAPCSFALDAADQTYLDQQTYRHNKLDLTTKTRTINEFKSNSNTDIRSSSYRYDNGYRDTYGNINTSTVNRAEQIELTEWYVYKGGVQALNDLEFLELVGDRAMYDQIKEKNDGRRIWHRTGYASIGLGLIAMIGGAALQASQPVIIGGALVTTVGFFITAYSSAPPHYIKSGYALNKIDEYNNNLKKQLNLPLSFE